MAENFSVQEINYSSRDFESIKSDILAAIPKFTKEWTDNNPTDFGIVLVELFAFTADVLHFYIDRAAGECFLDTAITEQSVINLLKLIDFTPQSAVPATVDLAFTVSGPVLIPAGTQVQVTGAEDRIIFETAEDLDLTDEFSYPASGTIGATEGETFIDNFGNSSGEALQKFQLAKVPVLDNSIIALVGPTNAEVEFTEIGTLGLAAATDNVFETYLTDDLETVVRFGDGINGAIPTNGDTIKITYRVGGGTVGNVAANTVTTLLSTFVVTVTVNNASAANGGAEKQSVEEAKVQGPKSLVSLDRAVTQDDYETIALTVPGVIKAGVQFSDPGDPPIVTVAILPAGGGLPSSLLKSTTNLLLNQKKMLGVDVEVVDPTLVAVDIAGTVTANIGVNSADLQADITEALDNFFDPDGTNTEFGGDVHFSDVVNVLDDVPGVDHVNLTKLTRQIVSTESSGFPSNGTVAVTITDENVLSTTVRCTISSVSGSFNTLNAQYTVLDIGNGVVLGSGTTNSATSVSISDPDVTGEKILFNISINGGDVSPANPNAWVLGDYTEFVISPYLGDIPLNGFEFPELGVNSLTIVGGL